MNKRTAIRFKNAQGTATWVDGIAPCVVLGSDLDRALRPNSLEILDRGAKRGSQVHRGPFYLTLVNDGRAGVPDFRSAASVACQFSEVVFRIRSKASTGGWEHACAWIDGLEGLFCGTNSSVSRHYIVHAPLGADAPSWTTALEQRSWYDRVIISITDPGVDKDESNRSLDQAAALAQLGWKIRPTLSLTRLNGDRWHEWSSWWKAATRCDGVSFDRPVAASGSEARALQLVPCATDVARFMSSAYASRQHDLTRTRPFALLLWVLSKGSASVPRCGSVNSAAFDSVGRALRCEHAHGLDVPPHNSTCRCHWQPFCDAVCAPCWSLRTLAGARQWGRWERLFCPAVSALMPMIIEDLFKTAQFEERLSSRPAGDRFRIAARDANLRVWSENVIADDGNRFAGEKHDGSQRDLSGIRTYAAGDTGGG